MKCKKCGSKVRVTASYATPEVTIARGECVNMRCQQVYNQIKLLEEPRPGLGAATLAKKIKRGEIQPPRLDLDSGVR